MLFNRLKKKNGTGIDPKAYSYEWMLSDAPAVFTVDLTLYDHAPLKGFQQLAFVSCRSLEGGEPTAETRRRIAQFIAKFAKNDEFAYVGSVESAGLIQHYFYIKSRKAWSDLKDAAASAHNFDCRAGIRSDAEWSTYFGVLYPDNAKRQTVLNSETINKRLASGDSDAPRRLNILLAFPSPDSRSACGAAALKEGFALGESDSTQEGDLPFTLVVHRIAAMKKSDIDAVTVLAVRLAENFGGRFVNWDCPIVPRRL